MQAWRLGKVGGSLDDVAPLVLQEGNRGKVVTGDRDVVAEREVWSQEIVVGDEERSQGDGAVPRAEAIGGADVILVGAIEAFDELFVRAELFRLAIEVLQTDDLVMRERLTRRGL